MKDSTFWTGPIGGIVQNILGGLLTVPAAAGFVWIWRKMSRSGFKKVFGGRSSEFKLVFGAVKAKQEQSNRFAFSKASATSFAYSASEVASACEVRAISYLATSLRLNGDMASSITSDENIRALLDIDFVSFGAMNNLKSMDLIANRENDLIVFNFEKNAFTGLSGDKIYHGSKDYGIILKLCPAQFPSRVWISCLGFGEWGTSGSAWFLANKWNELSAKLKSDSEKFAAVIEVVPGQDESASLVSFIRDKNDIPASFAKSV